MSLTSWFRDYVYIPLGGSRPDLSTKTKKNTACAAININIEGNRKHGDSVCWEKHSLSASADSVTASELPLQNQPLPFNSVSDDTESSPYKKTPDLSSDQENRGKQNTLVEWKRKLITMRNVFVVFMLCAIWHGANWTYLIWGLYHVMLFVPIILIGRKRETKPLELDSLRVALKMLLTFALVVLGWIMFRAETVEQAGEIMSKICSTSLWSMPFVCGVGNLVFTAIAIVVMMSVEWIQRGEEHGLALKAVYSKSVRYAIYIVLIVMILWNGDSGDAFLYFQF